MSTPAIPVSPHPVQPATRRRWLWRLLTVILLLNVFLVAVFYSHPLWVIDEVTRVWLRFAGVRSTYVQLGSFRMHYFVGGRGRPLVLVHGLDGRAENWAALMPTLMRNGYRVYAIDLFGFGRSDRPDVDYSIAFQADALKQFFDSQHVGRADLGGWSMGGWVALKFTLVHPERVRRIFVADSAGINFKLPFNLALFQPVTTDQAQQLLALLTPHRGWMPGFVARDVVRRITPMRWVVQRSMKSMLAGGDLLDGKLGGIQAPVLIVWGKQDAVIPLWCGGEMQRQIPQSRLAVFDGCGHLAPAECRGQVLPEIVHFLEAEPPLPPAVRDFPPDKR